MAFTKRVGWFVVGVPLLFSLVVLAISSVEEREELTEDVRAHAEGKFVALKHGRAHYILQGDSSNELVVFIHGGGTTGIEVWKKNIPYFSQHFRVLAFDLYGRGYSDRPLIANTPKLFSEQLTEILSKLEIKKPINIVALSMGAIVAFDYAEANPSRVKKVILIDPAATGDYRPNPFLKIPLFANIILALFWYPHAVENQRKEFVNQNLFAEYAECLRYFMRFKGFKFAMHSGWMNMQTYDRLSKLKTGFPSNTLLIYGAQDPYFNKNHCERYLAKIPHLEIKRIDSTGHMPHYEKPSTVNEIIYSFLAN